MRKFRTYVCVFLAAGFLLKAAGPLRAQSRKRVLLSQPSLRRVGQGSVVHTFQRYSYGLGNLNRPSSSAPPSLLRSRAFSSSRYRIRSPGSSGRGGAETGLSMRTSTGKPTRMYTPVSSMFKLPPPAAPVANTAKMLRSMKIYLDLQDVNPNQNLKKQEEPITSFVTDQAGDYGKYMAEGERLFRQNQYARALAQFRRANYLRPDNVESLLSMCHAEFALSRYATASFHLQQALRFLPELPTVPLKPRGFFKDQDQYDNQLQRLRSYLGRYPDNPDVNLLIAYFAWFDDDETTALEALENAKRAAENSRSPERLQEAIDTFLRGMKACGVERTHRPAAATQPVQAVAEEP